MIRNIYVLKLNRREFFMKRIFLTITILLVLLLGSYCIVRASAEDYTLFIDYNQNVFKGVPVRADVKLIGNNAPAYANVRVKVDIAGPGKPKLMATDSAGQEWDIAEIGYWGPPTGFAVGGTFTNTTPVTATFPEAGLYEIKLSLINVTDSSVIADSTSSIYVYRDQAELDEANNQTPDNNTTNETDNNAIEKLPQTGRSIGEYAIYTFAIVAIIAAGYVFIRKNQ